MNQKGPKLFIFNQNKTSKQKQQQTNKNTKETKSP